MSGAQTDGAAASLYQVRRVANVDLRLDDAPLALAAGVAGKVARHWQRRVAENRALFDGAILAGQDVVFGEQLLTVSFRATGFSTFLYWREGGGADVNLVDTFGSAVLIAADGAFLVGRAGASTVNAGRTYFIGGFIDRADAGADGRVDIDRSIARELAEEVGLRAGGLVRDPGYRVAYDGRMLSIGTVLRSGLDAASFRAQMLDYARAEPSQEIADIVVVRSEADVTRLDLAGYTAAIILHMMRGG